MALKMVSFKITKKYFDLIENEINYGNFATKADFFRECVRTWVKQNRPEYLDIQELFFSYSKLDREIRRKWLAKLENKSNITVFESKYDDKDSLIFIDKKINLHKNNIINGLILPNNEDSSNNLLLSRKIKDLTLHSEIYCCLICDNICGVSALEEGLPVVFHICFNCNSLEVEGIKAINGLVRC